MEPSGEARLSRSATSANRRLYIWYGVLLLVGITIILRLFYLQVIKHDYYKAAALSDQLKQYSIAPERGIIEAQEGGQTVPLVLNQTLYTLYGDPTFVKDPSGDAAKLANITHGDQASYVRLLKTRGTRYVVLAKKLSKDQSDEIANLQLPGIGTQGQDYRTYPQGSLAAQLLGFVSDGGKGTYGVEQALNKELAGTPGELKAITDVNGVPLAASKDNVQIAPKNGENIVLNIDLGMQAQVEKILAQEYQKTKSKGLSAVVIDPNNGKVKAMANYPTYDPSNYQNVSDPSLFLNGTVDNAIEPGSTMKNLTTAAALNLGVIQPNTTFYDPAHWMVDNFNITDIEEDGGAGVKSIGDILNLSLNTGATWMLMQMGGGQINSQARQRWHDYMVNHYQLGKPTGIEQGYEAAGYIPPPDKGYGLNLTYANTSFGQAVTITPIQMAAALSSVLNGGTYYQPQLVDGTINSDGQLVAKQPVVVKRNVVSPKVSKELQPLMEFVVQQHYATEGFTYLNFPANYSVGGKTGTAQVAKPSGGYYEDKFNGTYAGFVGGDKPQYVIVVYNIEPDVPGYAGSVGGQPVFSDIAHVLINDFNVTPKTGS